jgi:hypothetical protein
MYRYPNLNGPPPEQTTTVTARLPPDGKAAEFAYAHMQYSARRTVALTVTVEQLRSHDLFSAEQRLTPITPATLRAYREQWKLGHWTGHGGWNWEEQAHRYGRKPRSFHAAAWSGQTLCGLCVGTVCRSKAHLIIHFMESAPDPHHPLRGLITRVMFGAAQNYARVLGVTRIYLCDPLPSLRTRYASIGFSLACTYRGRVYFKRETS